jgi:hypothetical protein
VVFLLGLFGLANAWLAGSAFGLMFLSWVFAFSPLRSQFFARPPLRRLLQARREIEFRALNHIRLLESNGGLIWRCRELASHNPNLNRKLFRGILNFSANGTLLQVLRSRQHIRLYLLFLLEAQKAYQRLHQEYLEHHFRHLEQGWDDRLSATEAQDLQQSDPGRTE